MTSQATVVMVTDPAPITQPAHELLTAAAAPDGVPVPALTRRLAAAGLGVHCSRNGNRCTLDITGAACGGSSVIVDTSGQARWYFEPANGTETSPATLARVIAHLLRTPCPAAFGTAGICRVPAERQGRPDPPGPGPDRRPACHRGLRIL